VNRLSHGVVKGAMRRFIPGAIFAVLTLVGAAAPVAADTEHITQRLKLDPGGTLHLESFSGHVTITGSDQSEVTIDAVRRGSRALLDRVKLRITSDSSSVRIEENNREHSWRDFGHVEAVETDFDLKVPRRVNLDVTLFSASLNVTGVEGASHTVRTFSSRAMLDDVNGSIRIKSFSGPIEIRQTTWRGQPSLDVETFSGQVRLRLPESARGTVSFDSFSGRLTGGMPLTLLTSSRRHISGQFEASGRADTSGNVRVKSFSGSVALDR
jgi:DUF4097 and DUF4098 domain-containing protein YvlB